MIKFLQKKQRASALLISIIAMSAMFVVVFGSAYMVLINTSKEISLGDQLRARYLALAGAERLRYEVNKNSYDLNISCPTAQLLFSYESSPDFVYEVYCEEVEGENTFYSRAVYKNSFSIVPITFPFTCDEPLVDSRDGQTYSIVQIGEQCWMAEDLRYLPVVHSDTEFATQGANELPGYGVYGYDGSDVATAKTLDNYTNYGVLYNLYAAMAGSTEEGAQGICPDGWHVPTDAQWGVLADFIGTDPGRKLKSERTAVGDPVVGISTDDHPRWNYHATNFGTDIYNFSALPSGARSPAGSFYSMGSFSSLWSSSIFGSSAWYRFLNASYSSIDRYSLSLDYGMSLRCLKN